MIRAIIEITGITNSIGILPSLSQRTLPGMGRNRGMSGVVNWHTVASGKRKQDLRSSGGSRLSDGRDVQHRFIGGNPQHIIDVVIKKASNPTHTEA